MRSMLGWVFAAAFLAITPTTVAAKDKPPLAVTVDPSMPWNVDFGDEKCRLSRIFGEGENQHFLYFEQHAPSTYAAMTVSGSGFKRFRDRRETQIHLFDAQEPLKTDPLPGDTEEFGKALIYSGINLEAGDGSQKPRSERKSDAERSTSIGTVFLDTDFAAKTEYLNFEQGKHSVRLNTGPLGEAFKVLNQCTGGLVTAWGLDLEQHKTMTRKPEWTNQASIARRVQDSYPSAALRKGESAIFRMRVIVDEEGAVAECIMNKTTVADSLESPACKEMRSAEFKPALDAQGRPMRSYYVTSITYSIG
ncbi:MAG: energy transducer TonB [Erythrobacter sp.]